MVTKVQKVEERKGIPPALILLPLGLGVVVVGVVAAMALAAPPTPPPGRAALYGKVIDSVTGQPIPGVLITLDGIQVGTDSQGNYIFEDLDPGSYTVTFEKEGYQTAIY